MERNNITKALVFFIISVIVVIIVIYLFSNRDKEVYEANVETLISSLDLISFNNDKSIGICNLSDITAFEWDSIIFFGPYASKELIYEVVGYTWTSSIITQINEGMNQVVFIKNGEVVCHIQGYPDETKLRFHAQIEKDYLIVSKKNAEFEIRLIDGIYNIEYLKHEEAKGS